METCMLCPRQCGAPRTPQRGEGYCRMGTLPLVARAAAHPWEEPCISGLRGSGTVFFSGCALGCVFCQNKAISHQALGIPMDAHQLSQLFQRVEGLGVHNLNLVNPTHFAPTILEALALRKPSIPVVWNSSGYERVEMVEACRGLVDVFLPDLKYATGQSAAQLADAPDYFEVALAAIQAMCSQTGPPVYDGAGMLLRGTMVRLLVLPLRIPEAITLLDAIATHLPMGTPVSLMRQYTPMGETGIPGLNRPLTSREYARAREHMHSLGLPGYIQQKDSAQRAFTPAFMDEESTRLFPHTKP